MRAIHLYCELVSGAVLDGLQAEMAASGADLGAQENAPVEPALAAAEVNAEASGDSAQA